MRHLLDNESVRRLDPSSRGAESRCFELDLRRRIVGQDEAVEALVDLYQSFRAGMNAPGRPIGNLLFLGPTGTGKTRVVESMAEILFGDPQAMIKIDCAEFQHSHQIAKLIGSPPGYLGHTETRPRITQEALDRYHTEETRLSILLFDEIEKASESLWQLLLGILDCASLTLGNNQQVDLSRALIIMTSNLGGREIMDLMSDRIGFASAKPLQAKVLLDQEVGLTANQAARKNFSPEFMNRIDKVVVFRPLRQEQLRQILDLELAKVQRRILLAAKRKFLFRITASAAQFLLQEGTDFKFGARHLKRAIDHHVVRPLASLMATGQVRLGDVLVLDWTGTRPQLEFVKEAEAAEIPEVEVASKLVEKGLRTSDYGLGVEIPAAGGTRFRTWGFGT